VPRIRKNVALYHDSIFVKNGMTFQITPKGVKMESTPRLRSGTAPSQRSGTTPRVSARDALLNIPYFKADYTLVFLNSSYSVQER
jgi:hypothetical protein